MLTDEEFRREFLAAPGAVCRENALELDPAQLEALAEVDPVSLQMVAECLDRRIVRAAGGSMVGGSLRERGRR